MNQGAGYMEHQKAAGPENKQQESNDEEGSESHFPPPSVKQRCERQPAISSLSKHPFSYTTSLTNSISAKGCKSLMATL
jgi:hypothetical protein